LYTDLNRGEIIYDEAFDLSREESQRFFIETCQQVRFLIDNLLVRIHFIIVMSRWTGLAPWVFEFPFPGSLPSTLLGGRE